jgi:ATP-dependent Lhr-like helicase
LSDFVLRWQFAHPDTRKGSPSGLAETLARLAGVLLPPALWEAAVLPARVPEYQPRWLDDWIAGGAGAWVARGVPGESGSVGFLDRLEITELPAPAAGDTPMTADEQQILDALRQRGASFVADLASGSGMAPSAVRAALWGLASRSLAGNDHFDVIRRGKEDGGAGDSSPARGGRVSLTSLRRRAASRPEGRWAVLPWSSLATPETHAVLMASRLLNRYGVAARELALADPWMPPWRVLYEVLSRLELAGEVRRGYFAEGLSGAQFALPEAVPLLQEQHAPSTANAPVVVLHSLDPANLYGAGAPLDIPLLDGGTRSFGRRTGNWIVLRAGRPVLLVEQQGKKLTALPTASREDVKAAAACLPSLTEGVRNPRHKLTVEEWNGRAVTTTEGRELLEEAGFVRDYQGMTLYAVWR